VSAAVAGSAWFGVGSAGVLAFCGAATAATAATATATLDVAFFSGRGEGGIVGRIVVVVGVPGFGRDFGPGFGCAAVECGAGIGCGGTVAIAAAPAATATATATTDTVGIELALLAGASGWAVGSVIGCDGGCGFVGGAGRAVIVFIIARVIALVRRLR